MALIFRDWQSRRHGQLETTFRILKLEEAEWTRESEGLDKGRGTDNGRVKIAFKS